VQTHRRLALLSTAILFTGTAILAIGDGTRLQSLISGLTINPSNRPSPDERLPGIYGILFSGVAFSRQPKPWRTLIPARDC
jgi:hypothetical protein